MGERNYRGWQGEAAFTLIELMVVVLVMGILMAIGIPSFLSTRASAEEASAKSNATNALTNERSYFVNNGGFQDLTVVPGRARRWPSTMVSHGAAQPMAQGAKGRCRSK